MSAETDWTVSTCTLGLQHKCTSTGKSYVAQSHCSTGLHSSMAVSGTVSIHVHVHIPCTCTYIHVYVPCLVSELTRILSNVQSHVRCNFLVICCSSVSDLIQWVHTMY